MKENVQKVIQSVCDCDDTVNNEKNTMAKTKTKNTICYELSIIRANIVVDLSCCASDKPAWWR